MIISFYGGFTMDKINVLDVKFDNLDMKEAIEKCKGFLTQNESHLICTPNPELVMRAKKDNDFLNILNSSSLVIPDGIGIIMAGKILKTPLKERVAGFDLICNLLEIAKEGNVSFYFWGGKPGVAETAKKFLTEKYPNIKIVGTDDGYFDEKKEIEIIDRIKACHPDILLVGLGAPKQEKIINKYLNENIFKIAIGCGGSLDVLAGTVKRAPNIFIKLNLEWFYRLVTNPTRLKRMMVLPAFLLEVIKSKK
jgi:N-acetylglucosaminyldiphosphoundecaprenol N-acetyl-beta-D-mannosaminyltransferase